MAAHRIHVERLSIRVPQGAARSASELQTFAAACARQILRDLGATARGRSGVVHLDAVAAGPLRGDASATAREAGGRIARAVGQRLETRGRS